MLCWVLLRYVMLFFVILCPVMMLCDAESLYNNMKIINGKCFLKNKLNRAVYK